MNAYAENRKARHDYQILEKFEAGLALNGQEVKSVRSGQMQLAGSYVVFTQGKPELVGAKIPPWQPRNAPADYQDERPRQLLLHQKEIAHLAGKVQEKGFSCVPLKVYDKHGRIKLEFALAKGSKQFNKKEKIKKRDIERDTARELGDA